MSALTPHVRVLRVEAEALEQMANADEYHSASSVLRALAVAKLYAADRLEAEDQALQEKLTG